MTSHKVLKSITHNFSHSLISLMNYVNDDYFLGHLLKQARVVNQSKLEIDIIQNIATPEKLLTASIQKSIDTWNNRFPLLVKNSGSSMDFVKSATVTIEFDLMKTRVNSLNSGLTENPFTCVMKIVDDRGKEYTQKHEGWWYPEP